MLRFSVDSPCRPGAPAIQQLVLLLVQVKVLTSFVHAAFQKLECCCCQGHNLTTTQKTTSSHHLGLAMVAQLWVNVLTNSTYICHDLAKMHISYHGFKHCATCGHAQFKARPCSMSNIWSILHCVRYCVSHITIIITVLGHAVSIMSSEPCADCL